MCAQQQHWQGQRVDRLAAELLSSYCSIRTRPLTSSQPSAHSQGPQRAAGNQTQQEKERAADAELAELEQLAHDLLQEVAEGSRAPAKAAPQPATQRPAASHPQRRRLDLLPHKQLVTGIQVQNKARQRLAASQAEVKQLKANLLRLQQHLAETTGDSKSTLHAVSEAIHKLQSDAPFANLATAVNMGNLDSRYVAVQLINDIGQHEQNHLELVVLSQNAHGAVVSCQQVSQWPCCTRTAQRSWEG